MQVIPSLFTDEETEAQRAEWLDVSSKVIQFLLPGQHLSLAWVVLNGVSTQGQTSALDIQEMLHHRLYSFLPLPLGHL
jgi:hypothetical protein